MAMIASYAVIPKLEKFGKYYGLLDKPDTRKIHSKPIVRIGGVAIFIGCNFSFLLISILSRLFFPFFDKFYFQIDEITISIILCSTGFFLIGLLDDVYSISPYPRLFFQFLVSGILWKFGLRIENLLFLNTYIFKDYVFLSQLFSFVISLIWIVGVTNAINWIDGLDGLAGGFTLITSIGLVYVCILNKNYTFSYLNLCLAGGCLGFLLKNFYPASILMGDSGSYFLGMQLSALSVLSTNSNFLKGQFNGNISYNTHLAIIFLVLPILDMVWVIVNRLRKGKSPLYGDKSHFHHRLLSAGYSHKNVVFILLSFTIFTTLLAVSITSKIL